MRVVCGSILMPPPPSSSTAGATTWRLTDSPAVSAEGATTLQNTLLLVNAAGFLGGYYVLYNQQTHIALGLILATIWLAVGGHTTLADGIRKDRWVQAVLILWSALLVRSTLIESPQLTLETMWEGWGNSCLLVGFLLTMWQAGSRPQISAALGRPVVATAAIAAVISLVVFYGIHPDGVFGARLKNWLVYGGWNSVNSGLTFGFAACWAASGWNAAKGRSRRTWLLVTLVLHGATLLTLSRGAWLALICGHALLLISVGWRRAKKPVLLIVGVMALFQLSAPLISHLSAKDASKRLGIPNEKVAFEQLGDGVVPANPMQMAMTRSDNGRFLIYGSSFNSMTTWQDWLLGKGLWAHDDCWNCALHWNPEHLHSSFWDTFIHGGVISFAALLGIVAWGLKRAYHVAQWGEPTWIILCGYGLSGLLFDGDSIWALVTISRYEPLLFWTPLVIASARFTQLSRSAAV